MALAASLGVTNYPMRVFVPLTCWPANCEAGYNGLQHCTINRCGDHYDSSLSGVQVFATGINAKFPIPKRERSFRQRRSTVPVFMLWPLHHGLTVIGFSGSPAEHKCEVKPHEILPLSPTIVENNSWTDTSKEAGQESTGNHRPAETIPLVDQSKTQGQTQDWIRVYSGKNHSQWASEASRLPVGTYWRCDANIIGTRVGNSLSESTDFGSRF
jgi:hypothetical protein